MMPETERAVTILCNICCNKIKIYPSIGTVRCSVNEINSKGNGCGEFKSLPKKMYRKEIDLLAWCDR